MRIIQVAPSVIDACSPPVTWVCCGEHKTYFEMAIPQELEYYRGDHQSLQIALEKQGHDILDAKCEGCIAAKAAKDATKPKGKMSYRQFLLLKLAEECVEVAQRCSKQMQFGKEQTQAGDGFHNDKITPEMLLTNEQRLREEVLDFLSLVVMLQNIGEIKTITLEEKYQAASLKAEKIKKYLEYSQQLGMVE